MIVHTSPGHVILGFMLIVAGCCIAGLCVLIYDIIQGVRECRRKKNYEDCN